MLVTQTRQVKTNVKNAVQFSISDDASKLFSMLSVALYTDKERAVVYELGANCFDANPNEPFLIVAPTTLDQTIKFRDYGPGLSEKDVYRLLTVYGASDKSNSNNKIGGYGIGAKSPAAVTDTWTIVSYHGGKQMEFMVYISENGVPSLTKIRELPTDETGLEVVIPVSPYRIDSWKNALNEAFKYYPIKPIIKNCPVNYTESKFVSAGSAWKLQDNVFNSYNSFIKVIVTHRAYKLDASKLETEFKDDPMLCCLLKFPLIVDFAIGELQLSLSREDIQYTKFTINALRAKLETVKNELVAEIKAILDTAKDGFDYRQKIYDVEKNVLGAGSLRNQHSSKFLLGIIGRKHNITNLETDIKHYKCKISEGDYTAVKKVLDELKPKVYNGKSFQGIRRNSTCFKTYAVVLCNEHNGKIEEGYLRLSIPVMDKVKIVIADARDTVARVKYNFNQSTTRFVLVLSRNVFSSELDPYIIKASSLNKAPRQPRGAKQKIEKEVEVFGFKTNSLTRIPKPNSTKVAYVTFDNAKNIDSIKELRWNLLKTTLTSVGWEVVGIRAKSKAPKGYVNVKDAIRKEIEKVHSEEYWNAISVKDDLRAFNNSYRGDVCYTFLKMKDFRTKHKSVWNDLQDELSKKGEIKQEHSSAIDYSTYATVCEFLGITPVKLVRENFIDTVKTKLYNTYGMLKFVNNCYNNELIEEYINLVGK